MYENLDLFRISGAAAQHAARQQAQVATNIANADTPGYEARTIAPFGETYRDSMKSQMRVTRPEHIAPGVHASTSRSRPEGTEPSPNGNTVSLEQELVNSVDAEREHSRALAVYRHAIDIIRLSVGR